MGDGSLRGVHESLLMSYVTVMHEAMGEEVTSDQASKISAKWMDEVRLIGRSYLTTSRVWQRLFGMIVGSDTWKEGKEDVLRAIYEEWRGKDGVEAVIEWGRWLVGHGKGEEAGRVVAGATRVLGEEEGRDVEKRWREVVDVDSSRCAAARTRAGVI